MHGAQAVALAGFGILRNSATTGRPVKKIADSIPPTQMEIALTLLRRQATGQMMCYESGQTYVLPAWLR